MAFLGRGKKEDPLELMRQGKFKQAVKLLEEKLKQNPHEFSLKVRLAEAYEGDKRKGDAAQIYMKEAEVRLAAGELSDAVAMLKKAVRLTPENQFLVERLAQLERASKKEDTGDEAFTFDVDTREGAPEPAPPASAEPAPPASESAPEVQEEEQATAYEVSGEEVPDGAGSEAAAPAPEPPEPAAPAPEEPAVTAPGPEEPAEARAAIVPTPPRVGPPQPAALPPEPAPSPAESPPESRVREVEVQTESEEAGAIEEAPLEELPEAVGAADSPQAEVEPLAAAPFLMREAVAAQGLAPAGEGIEKIETPEFLEEEPEAPEGAPQALPEESPALLEEIAQVHEDTASLSLIAAPSTGVPPAAPAPSAPPQGPAERPPLPEAPDLTMETPSALLDETFSNFIALLFPDLSAEHLAAVRSVSKALQLQPDQVVVREGEEGDSLFILTRGRLEARGTFEGREITLGTFSPGDILGEVAFLNKVPRTATVRALEPSVVIELQGELTRKHLAPYPGLLNQLEVILQERVLKTLALLKKAEKRPDGNP